MDHSPSDLNWEPARPLMFLHIPKTAGTSLVSLLANRYPVGRYLQSADRGTGLDDELDQFDFVTGHVGYAHRRRFRRDPVVFVVLREPLERTLSAFWHFQNQRKLVDTWLQQSLPFGLSEQFRKLEELPANLSLCEFAAQAPELKQAWLCNSQTRQLVFEPFVVPTDISSVELLAAATNNLLACEVIGLTERLPESLQLLADEMGWSTLDAPPHQNESPGRPTFAELSTPEQDLLRSLNSLDLQLYATAKQEFQRRLSSRVVHPASSFHQYRLDQSETRRFSFADPIDGTGWHVREFDGQNWFSWLGRSALLRLALTASRPSRLRIHVAHSIDPCVTSGISLKIDSQDVPLTWRSVEGRVYVESPVPPPADPANARQLTLEFHAAMTVTPRKIDPANMDGRRLSIGLASIEFDGSSDL